MTEILILGGLIVVAVGLVIYALMPQKDDRADTLKRRTAGLTVDQEKTQIHARGSGRVLSSSMLEKAAPFLSRPVMPKNASEQSNLKGKLANAGFRQEIAATVFLASKTVGAILLGAAAMAYAGGFAKDYKEVVYYVVFGLGAGFMLPNLWLVRTIGKRSEAIRNGLPDSLDLMVVAVESGLGLDAAMLRVSDEMGHVHAALAEEFQIAMIETQMGVTRAEALTKMAVRTAVQEMKALVAVITQAEKLGTSIAKALRNQAESLRTKRRQRAEERAQKTAVKLLIPLVLFIFPAIFVVVAGPAAIHLIHTFSDGTLSR